RFPKLDRVLIHARHDRNAVGQGRTRQNAEAKGAQGHEQETFSPAAFDRRGPCGVVSHVLFPTSGTRCHCPHQSLAGGPASFWFFIRTSGKKFQFRSSSRRLSSSIWACILPKSLV